MGSLRLAHDLSIDEVDQKILSARSVWKGDNNVTGWKTVYGCI